MLRRSPIRPWMSTAWLCVFGHIGAADVAVPGSEQFPREFLLRPVGVDATVDGDGRAGEIMHAHSRGGRHDIIAPRLRAADSAIPRASLRDVHVKPYAGTGLK